MIRTAERRQVMASPPLLCSRLSEHDRDFTVALSLCMLHSRDAVFVREIEIGPRLDEQANDFLMTWSALPQNHRLQLKLI
jgi:hypothetical protein